MWNKDNRYNDALNNLIIWVTFKLLKKVEKNVYVRKLICNNLKDIEGLLWTVGGGADLVRTIDSTIFWEVSNQSRIESRNFTSCGFKTVASGLAIRCGLGHAVEVSNPLATVFGWRRRTIAHKVGYTWHYIVWNLSACYGGLRNGYNSYHAQEKHTWKVKASHCWEKNFCREE